MTTATTDFLQKLAEMKFEDVKNALKGKVKSINFSEDTDESGDTIYYISVFDETASITTIRCNQKGLNVHWGDSIPAQIRTLLEDALGFNDEDEDEDDYFDDLDVQWEEHYEEALSDILNDESLSTEKKSEGIKFLNYVNNSLTDGVLDDLEEISEAFQSYDFQEVIINGVQNLFGDGYKVQKHMLTGEMSIIKRIDEYSIIDFDPFVLDDGTMLAEYIVKKNDWYLTLHIYEDNPEILRFTAFEY